MKSRPLLALVALAAAGGCARSATAQRKGGPAPVPVTVAAARLGSVADRLDAVASVEPYETVSLKTQASGQIVAVRFAEGRDVRAGDLLFQIDPRPYRAALAQAEATLAHDEAQAQNAAADAHRAESLFAQGVLSREQHEQIASAAQATRARTMATQSGQPSETHNMKHKTAPSIMVPPCAKLTVLDTA